MSGEALYERYKEALKRGHVASLRGNLEEALAAYGEAASIAPDRSTAYTSAGTALLRHGRAADALVQYATAIGISARDEAALLGRAQALTALDRRVAAADAFDALAEARAASGRLADAVDAARRGLEMAEGRERRRTLQRLIQRLRATEPGEPGRVALERALLVLDGLAVSGPEATARPATSRTAASNGGVARRTPERHAESATVIEAEDETEGGHRRALDRRLPSNVDAVSLSLQAEQAVDAGVPGLAVERLLDLAAAYRDAGHVNGALDACYQALSLDPGAAGLHLALVELYDELGWTSLATTKLDLMVALAGLEGDAVVVERIAAARNARA
jgi:hypothetical protein